MEEIGRSRLASVAATLSGKDDLSTPARSLVKAVWESIAEGATDPGLPHFKTLMAALLVCPKQCKDLSFPFVALQVNIRLALLEMCSSGLALQEPAGDLVVDICALMDDLHFRINTETGESEVEFARRTLDTFRQSLPDYVEQISQELELDGYKHVLTNICFHSAGEQTKAVEQTKEHRQQKTEVDSRAAVCKALRMKKLLRMSHFGTSDTWKVRRASAYMRAKLFWMQFPEVNRRNNKDVECGTTELLSMSSLTIVPDSVVHTNMPTVDEDVTGGAPLSAKRLVFDPFEGNIGSTSTAGDQAPRLRIKNIKAMARRPPVATNL